MRNMKMRNMKMRNVKTFDEAMMSQAEFHAIVDACNAAEQRLVSAAMFEGEGSPEYVEARAEMKVAFIKLMRATRRRFRFLP